MTEQVSFQHFGEFQKKSVLIIICAYNIKIEQQYIEQKMSQLFQSVVSQFQSQSQYEKFIKQSEREFDVKIYRLSSFTLSHARTIYAELSQKYREKILTPNSSGWYQNERRLYVWFILCYMQMKLLDAANFVDSFEKYWRNISQVFWQKEIYFLKYQLLNIIKSKNRTTWSKTEDELLSRVFEKFALGQWNEVAKEFYHQSGGKFFKTPKQCRERWQNHLNKDIKKGDWTHEEDLIIFEFMATAEKKTWAKLVPKLDKVRTEHMIKNRYKSLTTKLMQERKMTEKQAAAHILKNLQKKEQDQDVSIQRVESQLLSENNQDIDELGEMKQTKGTKGKKGSKAIKREFDSYHNMSSLIKMPGDGKDGIGQFKLDAMDSSMLPVFLGGVMKEDSQIFHANSMYSSNRIILNPSTHFYPQNLAFNFFAQDRKQQERPQRLFNQSSSIISSRSCKNESVLGRFNPE